MMRIGPGWQLGRYKLEAELGRGGMGAVFEALDEELGRRVAVKVLSPMLSGDAGFVERFRREARTVASLRHPHIVVVHDWGMQDGIPYLVMELLDGSSLKAVVQEQGRLPLDTVGRIMRQCASALDFAHDRGVIHRDVKPANVMLDRSLNATLTDFGIARATSGANLTATGGILGTPEYLSPEQAMGRTVDRRSDVYSLGVMLFEALTGRVPFQSDSTPAILHMHAYEAPPPISLARPDLPLEIAAVLERALAKAPEQRFPTAGDLSRAFDDAVGGGTQLATAMLPPVVAPTTAMQIEPETIAAPKARRQRVYRGVMLGSAALVLVAMAIGRNFGSSSSSESATATPIARSAAVATTTPLPQSGGVATQPALSGPSGAPTSVAAAVLAPSPAVSPTPDRLAQLLAEGDNAFKEEPRLAVPLIAEAASRYPNSGLAYRKLAYAQFWAGDTRDQVKSIETAIRLDPSDARAYGFGAAVLWSEGQYERAAELLKRARELDGAALETQVAEALLAASDNRLEEARKFIDGVLRTQPGNELVHWAAANVLALDGDYQGALAQAEAGASQRPTWASWKASLGDTLSLKDEYDAARAAYAEALKLNPKLLSVYSGLGYVGVYEEKYDEAVANFETAIARDPRDARAYRGLGWVAYNRDEYEKALGLFRKAIELDPRDGDSHAGVGWAIAYGSGPEKQLEAEANFRKALQLNPRHVDAMIGLGLSLYNREMYTEALSSFNAAINAAPRQPNAYQWAGRTLAELNRLKEARQHYEKARELKPNQPYLQQDFDDLKALGG